MPSHPERVRRNYNTVEARTTYDTRCLVWSMNYSITRIAIASWISKSQAKDSIWQLFSKEIEKCFK